MKPAQNAAVAWHTVSATTATKQASVIVPEEAATSLAATVTEAVAVLPRAGDVEPGTGEELFTTLSAHAPL